MVSGKPNHIRFFRLSLRRSGPGVVSLRARQFAFDVRRGAGVVERGGLENRCALTRTVGSNPTLSAICRPLCNTGDRFARTDVRSGDGSHMPIDKQN